MEKPVKAQVFIANIVLFCGEFLLAGEIAVEEHRVPHAPLSEVACVVFSADGERIAIGHKDKEGTVRILQANTGAAVFSLVTGQPVETLMFSEQQRAWIASLNANRLNIWDLTTKKNVLSHDLEEATSFFCMAPDQKKLVVSDVSRILLIDVKDIGVEIWRHADMQCAVALSPDHQMLATAGEHGARLWSRDRSTVLQTIEVDGVCTAIAFSPESRYLVLASTSFPAGKVKLSVYETATGGIVSCHELGSAPNSQVRQCTFSPDGTVVAVVHASDRVTLFDLISDKCHAIEPCNGARDLTVFQSSLGNFVVGGLRGNDVFTWGVRYAFDHTEGGNGSAGLGDAWEKMVTTPSQSFSAMRKLVQSGERGVELIQQHLDSVFQEQETQKEVSLKLIKELDAADFASRDTAERTLISMGVVAGPHLLQAMQQTGTSPEARSRAGKLVMRLRYPWEDTQAMRIVRCLSILRMSGSKAALELLRNYQDKGRFHLFGIADVVPGQPPPSPPPTPNDP